MAKRRLLRVTVAVMLLWLCLGAGACNNADTTLPSETGSMPTDNVTNSATSATTGPPGNILEFEGLFSSKNVSNWDIPSQIHVMTTENSSLPNPINELLERYCLKEGTHYKNEEILDTVDFSRYFVILAFMGFQSVTGPTIEIQQIWQVENIIYVEALFDKAGPTYQPAWSSPYDVIKVSKEDMIQFGEITFVLLDQDGEERARTVYEIPE